MEWTTSMYEDYVAAGGKLENLPWDIVSDWHFYVGVPKSIPFWTTPGGALALVGLVAAVGMLIGIPVLVAMGI